MEVRDFFAKYIISNSKEPKDWKVTGGSFPPKFSGMRNYCLHILNEGKQKEKISAIKSFFYIDEQKSKLEAMDMIETSGRTKSVELFFKGSHIPEENTLNFIATMLDLPIKNIKDYELANDNPFLYRIKHFLGAFNNLNKRLSNVSVILLIVSVVAIGLLSFTIVNNYLLNQELTSQGELINKLSFQPEKVDQSAIVSGESKYKMVPVASDSLKDLVEFHTNNIYNTQYLIPEGKWNFPTDPNGEDIHSKYGAPYAQLLVGTTEVGDKITIANEKIKIRYNIHNLGDDPLVIDNIYLAIVDVYDATACVLEKGTWTTRSMESSYSVELIKEKRIYPMDVFINLIEWEQKFFSFEINTAPSLKGKIVRFEINISATDGRGNRVNIPSDKQYLVGLM